jgi:hypothetical protein
MGIVCERRATVGRLVRKNLVVDTEKVRELARQKGISESAAVRKAVEHALAAEEVMAAIRGLHALGGIDDVFGCLPDPASDEPPILLLYC